MLTFYEVVHCDGYIKMQKVCTVTDDLYIVKMPLSVFYKWQDGAHIQDLLPETTKEQREFLISGTTPDEWNEIFKKTPEEYEEEWEDLEGQV